MFVRFYDPVTQSSIYGESEMKPGNTTTVVEKFATNAQAVGVSEAMAGTEHVNQWRDDVQTLSQIEYNAAFLNIAVGDMIEEDAALSLDELKTKYPDGHEVEDEEEDDTPDDLPDGPADEPEGDA